MRERSRGRLLLIAASAGILAALAGDTRSIAAPKTSPPPDAARLKDNDAARRLADAVISSPELTSDTLYLCDRIGGRLTGTPACRLAVSWTRSRFEEAGLEGVRLEPFTLPRAWLPGEGEARLLAPVAMDLEIATVPYSPDTGSVLEARVFDAATGSPADIARQGKSARGAIGLVRTAEMRSLVDLFTEYMRDREMLRAAQEAGVAGLLLMSTRPRGLLYRHPIRTDGTLTPVPVALVRREHAQRIGRLLDSGDEVRVRLAIEGTAGGPIESHNVIADIPGRERPGEIVLFGAHLDSWDLGTGAEDNAVNCAAVIAVARAMKQLGLSARRTIRFALFTGEEQGLWGSLDYVRRHAAELDNHVAVVIMDIGSGRVTGYYLNGREELRGPVVRALEPVGRFGPFEHPIEAVDGTDNFDFLLSGVPNLIAAQDMTNYLPDYHAASDVFETVNGEQAAKNTAITAALLWHLAEARERPAPRQTRQEVEELIRRTGLEPQMKAFGQWDAWVSGRRGIFN